ncbi:hypothetical protein OG2516_02993 [Oceanicola granulosus HTCC2516]|uniref:DUF1127 domain-containing protein n=1 Tax=Oceanicola granulosus (strain ATCC BAA-861 / DSM 15982 / KCTC 12143 / HTCC2516) TaxID=314256 RepID=Q2C9Q3_OCEGH|nr:hypothetical protein [Oceanicola granulosus]EAR49408.1 hypothetical protein OG2516_02993 [Oceanicola granulosus HTCC2516]
MFNTIRTAIHNRALYNRTRRELEALPTKLAVEDLGIFPGDAHRIASKAVYGR